MDDQVLSLLAAQQNPATVKQAEEQLTALYPNEALPVSLVTIASSSASAPPIRQSALLNLKSYVLSCWSPELEEFQGQVLLSDDAKAGVREALLQLATAEGIDRKIQAAASYVVSKIAGADYPEQWSNLLQHLLEIVQSSPSDARLHGALKVLGELADGLEEHQFFLIARSLVAALYTIAVDASRNTKIRALAVSVFKGCFDTLQTLKEEHKVEIKAFAEQSLGEWFDLLVSIINIDLPPAPDSVDQADDGPLEAYRGLVALKVQVARVLIAIRVTFPSILAPRTPAFFSAVWSELSRLQPNYQKTYVEKDVESRSEDADGLAYTLDFLILEDLDFLQGCIRAPPVRKELETRLQSHGVAGSWITDLMKLSTSYAQITVEEEGMWEIDVNVFLAEETSVTANYTARTACGDLVIKVGEWQKETMLEGLLIYVRELYATPATASDDHSWRLREASLYVLDQVLRDWADYDRTLAPQLCQAFVELAQAAQQSTQPFLRARGYTVLGTIVKSSGESLLSIAGDLFNKNLNAIHSDQSEAVQVSCIRAIQAYIQLLPPAATLPLQAPIIQALQQWLSGKELSELSESEELLFTMVESLREIILLDARICLTGEALSLLFNIASSGAENFQMTNLVSETFEHICEMIVPMGSEAYTQLCSRVLPSLTGAFDVGSMTEENALMSLSADLLAALSDTAPSPLPAGFVSATLPKLSAVLLQHEDDELLKACTVSLKNVVMRDPDQLLNFTSNAFTPPKSGLEVVLSVVDRLLSPAIDDNAATEVGGLAAALVEKAGTEKLGQYLLPLLRAVASRVSTAEKADLIQNLILVFARLAAQNPKDVVDFLAQVQIEGQQGALQSVMAKWLDNCGSFAGFENIRLNILALSRLYELQDERLANTAVKGDIIIDSDRIVTRSRAKANPDRFTTVSVPLKIVKIFVEELGAFAGMNADSAKAAAEVAGEDDEEDSADDDEDWEDEEGFAGLSGAAKAELLRFAGEEPGSASRQMDQETQGYLENFFKTQANDARFQELYAQLNAAEQEKLRALA